MKNSKIVIAAFLFTVAILTVGYLAFGLITDLIFASGFLTGFIIWLFIKNEPSFDRIKILIGEHCRSSSFTGLKRRL